MLGDRLSRALSQKVCNPRLKKVTLGSFRHFFGTMAYYKTKIVYTQQALGHRNIQNTLALFAKDTSQYVPSKAPVFYNPRIKLNRDIVVLALRAYQTRVNRQSASAAH